MGACSPWFALLTPGVRRSGFSGRDCSACDLHVRLHTDVLSEVSQLNATARLGKVSTRPSATALGSWARDCARRGDQEEAKLCRRAPGRWWRRLRL